MMEKLLESWPLALVIIIIGFFLVFRSPISDLINRIRRMSYGNKSIDVAGAQATVEKQREDAPTTLATREAIPASQMPPASELYAPIEQQIRATLTEAKLSYDLEKAWLIRSLAAARVQRAHEMNYRILLGSQIALMLLANTGSPPTLEKAREIFDGAKAAYPMIYQNFAFEAWTHYPIGAGLLRTEVAAAGVTVFRITPAGRDFLHYLVDNALTDGKVG